MRALIFALSVMAGMRLGQAEHEQRDLTAREIVDTLAEYDVRHADQQPFFPRAYGATTYQTSPPQIYIFNAATIDDKRSTVIHELVHIRCHRERVECSEDYVLQEEQRIYEAMYP